jgi:uncharacterized membrane protein YukC
MRYITLFFAFVGQLIADFLIAVIKAFKNIIKLFSAMTITIAVFLLMLVTYLAYATAIKHDDIDDAHVTDVGELMGIDYDVIDEVA